MSLLGDFNDLISGQPMGTSDQIAATDAAVQAQEDAITQQKIADGTYNADQAALIQADYANQASNSVADQTLQLTGAAVEGAAEAATDPGQVLATGFSWEGSFLGKSVTAVANALKDFGKNFAVQIPWWLWLVLAGGLFIWLDGPAWIAPYLHGKRKR